MGKQEDIRPIYHELRGYLDKAPSIDKIRLISDADLWERVNQAIDELNRVSGQDYGHFRMIPRRSGQGKPWYIERDTYRTKLAGLVARLHGKYFPDESPPFGGMTSTVISPTQQQSQTQMQMVLDFQTKIDEQLRNLEPGDKKRAFLEKVKSALVSVKDYAGLLALCVTAAREFGLTLDELSELFK
ncbi:MAG: hypothetical protein ACYS74_06510 [Planctomycetota bacterium]|jgi:hypothetical protein